jgi:protein kinase A
LKTNYSKEYVVGRGGFGKVWKVQSKKVKNQVFALKEMSKARIIAKRSLNSVLIEKDLLSSI